MLEKLFSIVILTYNQENLILWIKELNDIKENFNTSKSKSSYKKNGKDISFDELPKKNGI